MEKIKFFQLAVLDWYKLNGRDLPWRQTTDPYKVMVAEIMLQQTQVMRVIPSYEAWLIQFPTVKRLAAASTADVIKAWAGLGYNRRALYLQKAAVKLSELSSFPTDYESLLKLPGVGSYTAAAILSFAFNTNIALVDTNIKRIYQLLVFGDSTEPTTKAVQAVASQYLPVAHSRDWHNALMDIGTIISKERGAAAQQGKLVELFPDLNAFELPTVSDQPLKRPKQSTFKESRRFWRGQILKLVRTNPSTKCRDLIEQYKECPFGIESIIEDLAKEGLIQINKSRIELPTNLLR